ncbi:MAG: cob(I)yrinic acid a,c-diamide adenosyltransferase [Gammaproteobacteria bacterium]|nr:cob(I)yrinic acid a,c-diamide adenosyltransferase [Gammaproteobacteria bacterium]
MGYRLSKIYTRTGDDGTTGLSDGTRIDKDSLRITAIGSIDELNSLVGLICSEEIDQKSRDLLTGIQHHLFDMGGELSMPGPRLMRAESVTWLEQQLDRMNDELDPLEDFILPGGCKAAAVCHVARSICRRAERNAFGLARKEEISTVITDYLNRLSDLLFILSRYQNKIHGNNDILWQHSCSNEQK